MFMGYVIGSSLKEAEMLPATDDIQMLSDFPGMWAVSFNSKVSKMGNTRDTWVIIRLHSPLGKQVMSNMVTPAPIYAESQAHLAGYAEEHLQSPAVPAWKREHFLSTQQPSMPHW